MTDYRDFDEPFGDKGGPPSEKSTRWILIVCFGILVLAGIAFASIGYLGEPITGATLADATRQPAPATTVTPGPMQLPPSSEQYGVQ